MPHLSECLTISHTAASTLQIFLDMAAVRPECFTEHVQKMKQAAELQPGTLVLVARILGIIGKLNIVSCNYCVFMIIFSCFHQMSQTLHHQHYIYKSIYVQGSRP